MGYREVSMVEMKEVLRLWMSGRGYRGIAEELGLDRKTVRRYVEAGQALGVERLEGGLELSDEVLGEVALRVRPGAPSRPGAMREHCRAHRERIEGWVNEGVRTPKIRELLGRLTRVDVPLRTLQRFITEEVEAGGPGDATVRVVDGEPGVEVQVDFTDLGWMEDAQSGKRRKLQALVFTAVYSRHLFVWPCFDQRTPTVIEGMEAAWDFFGGVFRVVIIDNLKSVVSQADALGPQLSVEVMEYAQARGFVLDTSRVRHPQDKPRVERSNDFVQGSYFAGESFRSLGQAREEARRWCLERAGQRIHGTTHARPLEVFEAEERAALLPAPPTPWDPPVWQDATIRRDYVVTAGCAVYSVPRSVERGPARVRMDRTTVKIYVNKQLVKLHPRQERGGSRIDPQDLPEEVRAAATRDPSGLVARAEGHGAQVGDYARRLVDHALPWTRMRHLYRLLGLVVRYGAGAVNQACGQALALEVVDVLRVERMLQRALEGQEPPVPPPLARVLPLRFARPAEDFAIRPAGQPTRPHTSGGPDATP